MPCILKEKGAPALHGISLLRIPHAPDLISDMLGGRADVMGIQWGIGSFPTADITIEFWMKVRFKWWIFR